jgi:hypothetical protein
MRAVVVTGVLEIAAKPRGLVASRWRATLGIFERAASSPGVQRGFCRKFGEERTCSISASTG